MSTRVEWMDSDFVHVEVVGAGAMLPDGQLTDSEALVISSDSVVVIEGDPTAFYDKVAAAMDDYEATEADQ